MFWGLSSNTLEVKAASYDTGSWSQTFTMDIKPTSGTVGSYGVNLSGQSGSSTISLSGTEGSTGSIFLSGSSGSTSVSLAGTLSGGSGTTFRYWDVDVTFPYDFVKNVTNTDLYEPYFVFWYGSTTCTVNSGTVTSFDIIESSTGKSCINNSRCYFPRSGHVSQGRFFDSQLVKIHLTNAIRTDGTFGGLSDSYSFTFSLSAGYTFGSLSTDEYVSNASTVTSDPVAQESLNNIESSSQAIETSVTSDTGGGLLATIKNFFGGFFSNLINSILGLFVPDSTYFSTWFDNLNTLLSDKLGMLYAPFDLLISTLNAVYSADTTEPGITFPGITWDGETVIAPYTFYFSSLGTDFQNLRDAVYFGTDVVLLFAFLHLLQKKIALVITGSEVNG